MGGVDYKGYTSDTLVHSDMSTNASIILITYATASPTQRKKFMQIVAVMNAELGAIEIDDDSNCNTDELMPLKLFIFVVKAKVVGSLLVEPIKHAFRLGCVQAQAERGGKSCNDVRCLNSTDRAENKGNTGLSGVITPPCECKSMCVSNERAVANSSPAVLDNERENGIKCKANSSKTDENAENANLVMAIESNSPVPAACGISRIWVSKKHRRHGIALKLLDACRRKYLFGCVLDKESIAFSQPTMEGMRLGRKFFGRDDFLWLDQFTLFMSASHEHMVGIVSKNHICKPQKTTLFRTEPLDPNEPTGIAQSENKALEALPPQQSPLQEAKGAQSPSVTTVALPRLHPTFTSSCRIKPQQMQGVKDSVRSHEGTSSEVSGTLPTIVAGTAPIALQRESRRLRQTSLIEMFERVLSRQLVQQQQQNANIPPVTQSQTISGEMEEGNAAAGVGAGTLEESGAAHAQGHWSLAERIEGGHVGPGLRLWMTRSVVKSTGRAVFEELMLRERLR
ncbi:hypothetical protein HDU77_002500 [Chytriomyces hyalinus]|nr:hypothetical protein HDU77_002500 [Chytriomyces hyalinus]